jgi:carbon storage regulator
MLVLSRKIGERILIGEEISITVVRVAQGGVRLGIVAPSGLAVMREELCLPDARSLGDGADMPDRAAKLHS